jgi:hypothetical protein
MTVLCCVTGGLDMTRDDPAGVEVMMRGGQELKRQ